MKLVPLDEHFDKKATAILTLSSREFEMFLISPPAMKSSPEVQRRKSTNSNCGSDGFRYFICWIRCKSFITPLNQPTTDCNHIEQETAPTPFGG
jgi:hypothetical protein